MRNITRKHENYAGHERIGKKLAYPIEEETAVLRKLENPLKKRNISKLFGPSKKIIMLEQVRVSQLK
jgi:nickel-dependent lactate racemase